MASVVLPSRAGSQNARKGLPLVLSDRRTADRLGGLAERAQPAADQPVDHARVRAGAARPTTPTPPPVGNFDPFGLGDSSSIDTGGAPGGEGEGVRPARVDGKNESKPKRCVQTAQGPQADRGPASRRRACPTFDCRENGGATYQGVTKDEIRLLFYFDSGIVDIRHQPRRRDPSREQVLRPRRARRARRAPVRPRCMRGWQRYFEDRYQTYCRHAALLRVLRQPQRRRPEAKRADAADNFQQDQALRSRVRLAGEQRRLPRGHGQARRAQLRLVPRPREQVLPALPEAGVGLPPAARDGRRSQYADFFCKQIKPYKTTLRRRRPAEPAPGGTASSTPTTPTIPSCSS